MNKENFTTEHDVCSLDLTSLADFGKFCDATESKQRLDDYFTVTGQDPKDPKLIFGQLLGLNTVKTLISRIDEYNNNQQPQDKIAGIRIYNAMSKREFLPPPDDSVLKADVLILPVFADGSDFYKIAPLFDQVMGVGGAMPCPNQC